MKIASLSRLTPFIVFAIFSLLTSCAADDILSVASIAPVSEFEQAGPPIVVDGVTQSYINTDSKFWPYFERFEKEAKSRGVFADLHDSGMTVEFANVGGGALSECIEDAMAGIHNLNIDKTFWISATDGEKELVVFNALGYCFLGKTYKDDASSNGICLSIMRSETAGCMDNYNANTRDVYLDELFGN